MNTLNDRQREAVVTTEGPLLILAGAGSGKTRVITYRIAYLIEEMNVNPWNIMAITFTNKAAGEMRERIDNMVGFGAEHIWVSTFHSSCVKILRRFIDRIGYDNNFTIYDTDDQKSVMKDIFKRMNIDSKQLKEKAVLGMISSAKNEMISPTRFKLDAGGDYALKRIGDLYEIYQEELRKNNALDFDDLLVKTVELFEQCPDVLENYQERFKYIMVDEYQDTNTVQFKMIDLLASKYRNLCVVGDDDQSIYKFRGANIRNILNFEKVFTDAKVIKLEQNYRSTGNILNAANGVIAHNIGRKSKALWTTKDDGEKIKYIQYENAYEEAEGIAKDIENSRLKGYTYSSQACLYRTNAQSRVLEEKLLTHNIPYKIIGGINFYQRKEVKDLLAYLKTIANGNDDVAVKRIINVPKRGIGATSIDKIAAFALDRDMNFYEACGHAEEILGGRASGKVSDFYMFIKRFKNNLMNYSPKELLEEVIALTGYEDELRAENTEESLERIENIKELVSKVADYEENTDEPTLSGLLEEIALVADVDELENSADYVVLMTIHSAKGLEFPKVFLCGMEDGMFPSYMSISGENSLEELEEERRLCYVAITRAMKELVITCAKSRMLHGEMQYNRPSRFISEIPKSLIATTGVSLGNAVRSASGSMGYDNRNGSGMYRGSGGGVSASAFLESKKSFAAKPFEIKKQSEVEKPSGLSYNKGDTVRHIKFGTGVVVDILDAGRDYEVTVNFENYGVKKLFATFAKLKKVE